MNLAILKGLNTLEPNYADYSLSDLEEALSSIDRDLYPVRVSEIENEIAKRHKLDPNLQQKMQDKVERELGFASRLFLFVVSILTLVYGIEGLMSGEIALKNQRTVALEDSPFLFYVVTLFFIGIGGYITYLSIFGKKKSQKES